MQTWAGLLADSRNYKALKVNIVINPESDSRASTRHLPPAGRVDYWSSLPDFGPKGDLERKLEADLAWAQLPVRLFGRSIPQPRLTAFYGEPGISYRYSGLTLQARGWTDDLQYIRTIVQRYSQSRFNSVLCNLYRSGNDYMGWHADDEPELGPKPTIASVSLGAARRFVLKPRDGGEQRYEYLLAPRSLLVMSGDLQRHWLHQLPKALRVGQLRINLTFRLIS